jgi:hypothetical protein
VRAEGRRASAPAAACGGARSVVVVDDLSLVAKLDGTVALAVSAVGQAGGGSGRGLQKHRRSPEARPEAPPMLVHLPAAFYC